MEVCPAHATCSLRPQQVLTEPVIRLIASVSLQHAPRAETTVLWLLQLQLVTDCCFFSDESRHLSGAKLDGVAVILAWCVNVSSCSYLALP